jgi:uncharacterized membrane protein YesL
VVLECVTYYKLVFIFELLLSRVLLLYVIAFTYVMTVRHLMESSIFEGKQNPKLKTCRNTAKIVVGLTVVFLICCVLSRLVGLYNLYSKTKISAFKINRNYS